MYFNNYKNEIINNMKKINLKDLIIFLIPFLIFLYYLYVYNPGILTSDAYNQLHQIATHHFTNWHPFFHTFIEMVCFKIYSSPLTVGILQILIFSTIWMIICKYNRNEEEKINKLFILQVIITLIIALIPLNAIYSITLGKDVLFTYFLMFLCFLIKVIIDRDWNINYKLAILISITMAIICQLRPNGMILILTFLTIFTIILFKKNRHEKAFILIPTLTIILILLISGLNVAYDVHDTQKDVILDKTVHVLSYYDLNVEMSQQDEKILHELISKDDIKNQFNLQFTDPTYKHSHKEVYKKDRSQFIWMAIKYTIKNPMKFIDYFLGSSVMVWDVIRGDDWTGHIYRTNYEIQKDNFYKAHNTQPAGKIDNESAKNVGTTEYNNLNSLVEYFKNNKFLETIFYSSALYMYLALIVLGLLYILTRNKEIFLIYLPNLISILIVMVSTPIQSIRYLYGNFMVFYLLIIILIGVLWKKQQYNFDTL